MFGWLFRVLGKIKDIISNSGVVTYYLIVLIVLIISGIILPIFGFVLGVIVFIWLIIVVIATVIYKKSKKAIIVTADVGMDTTKFAVSEGADLIEGSLDLVASGTKKMASGTKTVAEKSVDIGIPIIEKTTEKAYELGKDVTNTGYKTATWSIGLMWKQIHQRVSDYQLGRIIGHAIRANDLSNPEVREIIDKVKHEYKAMECVMYKENSN